jgi:hypothetical protein
VSTASAGAAAADLLEVHGRRLRASHSQRQCQKTTWLSSRSCAKAHFFWHRSCTVSWPGLEVCTLLVPCVAASAGDGPLPHWPAAAGHLPPGIYRCAGTVFASFQAHLTSSWAELCVDDTLENAAAPHDTATLLALLADCPPFLTAHPASMCCCATAAKPPCLCAGGGPDGPPLVRHCINCFRAVEGAVAAEDAVLQGALDLFCSLDCERSWSIKSSSGEGPCGCLEISDRTGMSQEMSRHSCTCDRPLACASCDKPFAPVGTPGGWFRCTKVCGVAHELACGVVLLRFRWHPSCAVQA